MSAEYHAGLDIGASSVKCVVAVTGENGEPIFAGLGASECRNSVRDGILVDMEGAAASALRAMEEAEELCGFRIEKVCLGIGGAHVRGLMGTGTIGTGTLDDPGVITDKDVSAALDAAGDIDLPPGCIALDRITRDFAFDRFTGACQGSGRPPGVVGHSAGLHGLFRQGAGGEPCCTCGTHRQKGRVADSFGPRIRSSRAECG